MSRQLTYAAAWPYQSKRHKAFIHLMIQSPTTLYAYWAISEQRKHFIAEHYHTRWNKLTKQVRLVDVSQLSEPSHSALYWDVTVGERESWYFQHVRPNTAYRIDYGILNSFNQFIALCCSSVATSPRNEDNPCSHPRTCTQEEDRYIITSMEQEHAPRAVTITNATQDHSPFPQFSTYSLYPTMDIAHYKH